MHTSTQKLIRWSEELGVDQLAKVVLESPRFDIWSGSSKPTQHHYGKHGLTIHTHEVVNLCMEIPHTLCVQVNTIELFLSAVFHDCGKMFDYKPARGDFAGSIDYNNWVGTDHKRLIHHVSRSALIWQAAWDNAASNNICDRDPELVDRVLHNILSHHGQRQWGSPVMPKTKEAWLLHLCDGISARMNDADKWDFVADTPKL